MEKLPLPADFKDFLQLLNSAEVEYLLVVITSASGVEFAECYARRN